MTRSVCVLGILAALYGCGPPRWAPATPQPKDPAAVLTTVRQHEDEIRSLRARFKATATQDSDASDVQGVLLVRKPDRFRMRLMLPFGITVLDYVSQGDRTWTLLPLSKEGDAAEARLFSPADVRQTFLRGAAAFPGECTPSTESAAAVEVACRSCDDCPLLRSFRFNQPDATIAVETSYEAGEPQLVIHYEDYRDVDGLPLPFHIVMAYPARRLKVEIRIAAYEVNPPLGDGLFEPPQGAKLETVAVARPDSEN